MQNILNQTIPLDIQGWTVITYVYEGKQGNLNVVVKKNEDWVCFDSNPYGDCESYLDIVLNTVNGMLLETGEIEE